MSSKHKITLFVWVFILLVAVAAGCLTGLFFYLPYYLESRIIPQLAAETGISSFAFKIRHMGFFGADLGVLRIGPEQNPALLIRSAQIDYSPKGLYRRKIKRMTIEGIELHAEFKAGKFFLRGIGLDEVLAKLNSKGTAVPESESGMPPIFLEELEIRNANMIVNFDDRQHRIPFEITVTPENSDYKLLKLAASFYPRGQLVRTVAKIDLKDQQIILNSTIDALDLNRFSDLIQTIPDLMVSGQLDLRATADLQLAPFKVSAVDASAKLHRCKIGLNNLLLQNARGPDLNELPFKINLSQTAANEFKLSGSAISMASPIPLTLSGWQGRIRANGQQLESAGEFNVSLLPSSTYKCRLLPVEILDSLPLQGNFTAEYNPGDRLKFGVNSTPLKRSGDRATRFGFNGYQVSTGTPAIILSANGPPDNLVMEYSFSVPELMIASPAKKIHLPRVVLTGTAHISSNGKSSPEAIFKLETFDTSLQLEAARGTVKEVILSGRLKTEKSGAPGFEGSIHFAGAGLEIPETGLKISGVRGEIPLKWPPDRHKKDGNFLIAALNYRKMNFGEIRGKIKPTAAGFALEGRHISRLIPELSLNFSGDSILIGTANPTVKVDFTALYPDGGAEIDLGKFLPGSKGIKVGGKLMLTGNLFAGGSGFNGSINLQVDDASVRNQKSKFAVEGIRMALSIPELPDIRSAPGQHLMFSKVALGDLVAKDGRIDFQVESARSFLIEKSHFIWCDGKIDTQSMRISPGVEDYRITFYCDRLNLAKVLEQFGAATAEGEGTVNGRIPLQYSNGKIRFDDGFLFSTPGNGGKINLKGTDILTAGIPPNTPQYVQMELAREALKDYDYSWAKLNITSEGEELLLQMQMDGKPAKMLPFVYRKDIGGFVKVEAESKGSKFQGIRLDVNFRLPLNKMLQYKGLIKMIQ